MKSQKGFTLVEVLVAVALLSIIGVGLLAALGGASKVLLSTDIHETARDLAQAQIEYIHQQPYNSDPSLYEQLPNISSDYPGYSIVDPMVNKINEAGNPAPSDPDIGIQQIIIQVQKDGKTVFTLYGRKVQW